MKTQTTTQLQERLEELAQQSGSSQLTTYQQEQLELEVTAIEKELANRTTYINTIHIEFDEDEGYKECKVMHDGEMYYLEDELGQVAFHSYTLKSMLHAIELNGHEVPVRVCNTCGELMTEGYLAEQLGETLCSDACLFVDGYTREQYAEDYELDAIYYTTFD